MRRRGEQARREQVGIEDAVVRLVPQDGGQLPAQDVAGHQQRDRVVVGDGKGVGDGVQRSAGRREGQGQPGHGEPSPAGHRHPERNRPAIQIVRYTAVANVVKAIDTTVYTTDLPVGTQKRIEAPHDGMNVWVTRTVTRDGVVIHQETIYSDYKKVDGELDIGVAPSASTPAPSASSRTTVWA